MPDVLVQAEAPMLGSLPTAAHYATMRSSAVLLRRRTARVVAIALSGRPEEDEMRRSTTKTKKWQRIHARKLHRRTRPRGRQRAAGRSRPHSFDRIPCPEHLSLEDDYEGVLKLIDEIRSSSRRNERTYIDFTPIRTVKPSGALVLAAEIDRWNSLPGRPRFKSADTKNWAPNVRKLLGQMGFFELLGLSHQPDTASEGPRYIKLRSGTQVDGEAVEELRTLDLGPVSVPKARLLFAAVTEAMTNVVHHAYEAATHGPRRWWLSAAHEAGQVEILIYDQGTGIPKTLPLTLGERVRDMLPGDFAAHDGKMIEVAHSLSKSGTREAHRGRGLGRDVRRYIEEHDKAGTYCVISGRGEYTVPAGKGATGQVKSHPRALRGTLIRWRLTL